MEIYKGTSRISVLKVYEAVMKQAMFYRNEAHNARTEEYRGIANDLAQAYYSVGANLESTEEVNPTFLEVDYYSRQDLPAIGTIIERDGRSWRVTDNVVRNVSKMVLV